MDWYVVRNGTDSLVFYAKIRFQKRNAFFIPRSMPC